MRIRYADGRPICVETGGGSATVTECEIPSNGRGYQYDDAIRRCTPMHKATDPGHDGQWTGTFSGGHVLFTDGVDREYCRDYIACIGHSTRSSVAAPSSAATASPSFLTTFWRGLGISTPVTAPAAAPSAPAVSWTARSGVAVTVPSASPSAGFRATPAASAPMTPAGYVRELIARQAAIPAVNPTTAPTMMAGDFRAQKTCNDINETILAVLKRFSLDGIRGREAWLKINAMGYGSICNATHWDERGAGRMGGFRMQMDP